MDFFLGFRIIVCFLVMVLGFSMQSALCIVFTTMILLDAPKILTSTG